VILSKEILSALGVILALGGYGVYLYGIWRGTVRPHFFTWFIWGIVMSIGFAAQYAAAAGPGMWVTGISAGITLVIAAWALKKGERHITRSDWVFFIAALVSIPVWLLTETPLYTVLMISLIDAFGFYPTFRKSWTKPWEESITAYTLAALQFVFSVLAMDSVTIITSLYPLTISVLNALLIIQLIARRRWAAKT
jgi:hypothetical protein